MENEDKKELSFLEAKMLACGYKTKESDFFKSKEYIELVNQFIRYFPEYYAKDMISDSCTLKHIKDFGRDFIDVYTYGTDSRVRYANMDSLTSELHYYFGEKPEENQYEEISNYINNNVELLRVCDVPLELSMDDARNGFAGLTWFYGTNDVSEDFYKIVKPAIIKIALKGPCDAFTNCTYVHEMYHALAYSHKGSIENLLHDEVLPIFMEKVASLDLDDQGSFEEAKELSRLQNDKLLVLLREQNKYVDENEEDTFTYEDYIESTALATALYHTYKYGNNDIRKEIINSINGIFKENHTLEDVLQKYEATPEKGSKIMRRHIKKLSK